MRLRGMAGVTCQGALGQKFAAGALLTPPLTMVCVSTLSHAKSHHSMFSLCEFVCAELIKTTLFENI